MVISGAVYSFALALMNPSSTETSRWMGTRQFLSGSEQVQSPPLGLVVLHRTTFDGEALLGNPLGALWAPCQPRAALMTSTTFGLGTPCLRTQL